MTRRDGTAVGRTAERSGRGRSGKGMMQREGTAVGRTAVGGIGTVGGIEVNSPRNDEWEAPAVGEYEREWEEAEKWSDRVWESMPVRSRRVRNSGNDNRNVRGGGESWTTVSGSSNRVSGMEIELKY